MKLKNILSALLVAAVISAGCFAEDTNKVDLKLRLKAGESHEMKITKTQNTSTTANGRERRSRETQEMVVGLNVLGVDANGTMDVEIVCKSLKKKVNSATGNFEFDSATPKPVDPNIPGQKMSAAALSEMVGSKIQAKIKPTGEFYDVRGLDAIIAKIKEKDPPLKNRNDFHNMFSDEKVKEMAGNILGFFPAGPVAVGDSWHKTAAMSFVPLVPRDVDITYTLKQRKDRITYIDAAAKFDTGVKTDHNNRVSEQSAGTIQSSIEMDEATGLTRKSNIAMNISGETKMAADQQMLQGMKASSTIQGNTVVELIK